VPGGNRQAVDRLDDPEDATIRTYPQPAAPQDVGVTGGLLRVLNKPIVRPGQQRGIDRVQGEVDLRRLPAPPACLCGQLVEVAKMSAHRASGRVQDAQLRDRAGRQQKAERFGDELLGKHTMSYSPSSRGQVQSEGGRQHSSQQCSL